MRRKILYLTLALATLLSLMHLLAIKLDLYWIIQPFDTIMHFLGGATVFMFFCVIFIALSLEFNINRAGFYKIIFLTLLVGVIWEIFEVNYGITFVSSVEYKTDTALDIILDLLGGIAAYQFIQFLNRDARIAK